MIDESEFVKLAEERAEKRWQGALHVVECGQGWSAACVVGMDADHNGSVSAHELEAHKVNHKVNHKESSNRHLDVGEYSHK